MQLAVRLNTARDYVIAGIALAIIVLALLYSANSIRTSLTMAVG